MVSEVKTKPSPCLKNNHCSHCSTPRHLERSSRKVRISPFGKFQGGSQCHRKQRPGRLPRSWCPRQPPLGSRGPRDSDALARVQAHSCQHQAQAGGALEIDMFEEGSLLVLSALLGSETQLWNQLNASTGLLVQAVSTPQRTDVLVPWKQEAPLWAMTNFLVAKQWQQCNQ